MPKTDFYIGLTLLITLMSGISASCPRPTTCPCGTKGKLSYAQCIDATDEKDICERWAKCETCESNTAYCLSCPKGLSGSTCEEDCGRSGHLTEVEIPEGRSSQIGEFPWIVYLLVNDTGVSCAGVLLDKRTVLTAANCFEFTLHYHTQITLYFGKYNWKDENNDRNVITRMSSQIIVHPRFNGETFDNDIAIVKFSPDISYSLRIQPICMPSPDSSRINLVPGRMAYVIGWWLNKNRVMPLKQTVVPIPIQAPETCISAYAKLGIHFKISTGMFCAGFADQINSVCRGSSGAPLVFYDRETGRFTMEGLSSHGTAGRCDLPERYTMFTRVSHYLKWIIQNL